MAKCIDCNKRGLFLKLNKKGQCQECETSELKRIREAAILKEAQESKAAQEALRKKRREEYLKNKLNNAQQELINLPRYKMELSSEKRKRQTGFEPVKFSNITPKGKYTEFVVFDTETTGLAPSKDRIIELAAIRFVDGLPTEVFETLINPQKDIPKEASSVNKITSDMVKDAPTISEILPSFESFVGNSPLIAHNLEFDLKFLYYSGSNIINDKRKFYDTLEQSRKLLKGPKSVYDKELGSWEIDYDKDYDVYDHKLETLCEYYQITIPFQHRAAADALATGKLFLELVNEKQSR